MFYLIIPNTFKELTSFADNLPSYLEKPFEAGVVDKILEICRLLPETLWAVS